MVEGKNINFTPPERRTRASILTGGPGAAPGGVVSKSGRGHMRRKRGSPLAAHQAPDRAGRLCSVLLYVPRKLNLELCEVCPCDKKPDDAKAFAQIIVSDGASPSKPDEDGALAGAAAGSV